MKKLFFIILLLSTVITVNAQFMRTEELEKYSMYKYGENWVEAAKKLSTQIKLDKNKSFTYVQVIDCGKYTKDVLYVILNYWFTASFNDANAVIKLNDKNLGVIIGEGYVSKIAEHIGGVNAYEINIKPIIKVDIKDYKIRITFTVQYYDVDKYKGCGIIGFNECNLKTLEKEKWPFETCYPFVKKDMHNAKKTSSKALIMMHAYSNVIIDKIKEAVKNGLIGNENDCW